MHLAEHPISDPFFYFQLYSLSIHSLSFFLSLFYSSLFSVSTAESHYLSFFSSSVELLSYLHLTFPLNVFTSASIFTFPFSPSTLKLNTQFLLCCFSFTSTQFIHISINSYFPFTNIYFFFRFSQCLNSAPRFTFPSFSSSANLPHRQRQQGGATGGQQGLRGHHLIAVPQHQRSHPRHNGSLRLR